MEATGSVSTTIHEQRVWVPLGATMKTNQLRALVGKLIQWEEYYCPKAGHGLHRVGRLIEVRGKNLLVDQMGSLDWKWVPNMLNIKVVDAQE